MSLDCIYRGELPPRHFNTAPYCLRAVAATPGKPALLVVHDAAGADIETWSYEALEAAILRVAHAFRCAHGLKAGARVAIRLRNRMPYALAFFGAIAGGRDGVSIIAAFIVPHGGCRARSCREPILLRGHDARRL